MEILQVNEDQQKKLATVLKNFRIQLFEYIVDEDKLVVYDDKFHIKRTVTDYMEYIDHKSKIHPDDREKVKQKTQSRFVRLKKMGQSLIHY